MKPVFMIGEIGGKRAMDSCVHLLKSFLDDSHPAPSAKEAVAIEAVSVYRDCDECPVMARIPGGRLQMPKQQGTTGKSGSAKSVPVKAFAIGVNEITQAEFKAFVEDSRYKPSGDWSNPARYGGALQPKQPVVAVSLGDVLAYVKWLSLRTGKSYRLPTEAEWLYAAQGGNPGLKTTGRANAFGLYGMSGGVWEIVGDCGPGLSSTAVQNHCAGRGVVIRGGLQQRALAQLSYGALSTGKTPAEQGAGIGFRVAISQD